jgi:hypothetical protein
MYRKSRYRYKEQPWFGLANNVPDLGDKEVATVLSGVSDNQLSCRKQDISAIMTYY